MNDASDMLASFKESIPAIVEFLNALCIVSGVYALFSAFYWLIQYNRQSASGSVGNMSLSTPAWRVIAGIMLINVADSMSMILGTMFGSGVDVSNLLAYNSGGSSLPEETKNMIAVIVMFLRVYGLVTYYRGWNTAKNIGNSNSHDDSLKIATIRIVFGAALMNIVQFVNVITSTFGYGDVL